jgi:small-conductance mechanosensitive channel
MTQERKHNTRWLTITTAVLIILILVAATTLAAIYIPKTAIYVPVIAVGLALALQKYTASFIAHFVINFSNIYAPGDRIRIGNIKGDVRRVGIFHTILEEVGEDEKLGGELTGRLLHVPNLIILDLPVLNYSKDYSVHNKTISSDFMFDEVRIPITTNSNVEKATNILEHILKSQDEIHIKQATQIFEDGYPEFLSEAMTGPRVLIFIEPQHIWIKGKFVTPLKGRNELKSRIQLEFFKEINASSDIKLA